MTRPDLHPPELNEIRDWLVANGIDEWLPEDPVITVAGDQIMYTAFQFTGERGWDPGNLAVHANGVHTEIRTVPLLVPPTDRIRALAYRLDLRLEVR